MGRAPCCDKEKVKKGPWSPEEDAKLKSYIEQNGTGGNWIALPQKVGLKRCGKSCRLRWLNYLRPNLKHGAFSEEEDNIICSLFIRIGSRWSLMAAQLPGRTDNDIKNYWNTKLKKKLLGNKDRRHNLNPKTPHQQFIINSTAAAVQFSSGASSPQSGYSWINMDQPTILPAAAFPSIAAVHSDLNDANSYLLAASPAQPSCFANCLSSSSAAELDDMFGQFDSLYGTDGDITALLSMPPMAAAAGIASYQGSIGVINGGGLV